MSTQHTPGEWTIFEGGSDRDFPGIEADDFSIVCFGDSDDPNDMCGVRGRTLDEAWANARLFRAAPDMLKALKQHDAYMLDAGYSGPESDALHPKAAENWRRVRAAIAKATTP